MEQVECTQCGHVVTNPDLQRVCPNCNAVLSVPGVSDTSSAAPGSPRQQSASGPQEVIPPAPDGIFPERMLANKALAGRNCTGCEQPIELGDDVWNCQTCQTSMHQACRDKHNGCANLGCPAFPKTSAPALAKAGIASSAVVGAAAVSTAAIGASGAGAVGANDTIACVGCGKMILKKSRKCRFCDEYQSPAERERAASIAADGGMDDNLTGAEIAFGILCASIACILGIVWMVQGKKKGGKLVLISLATQAAFALLGGLR